MGGVKHPRGFDRVAVVYDSLARLVYGRTLRDAQVHFLDQIQPPNRILLLGGGTGWLLRELRLRFPDAEIANVEASRRMTELSRELLQREGLQGPQVQFIQERWRPELTSGKFDLVATPFFLDLFDGPELRQTVDEIAAEASEGADWLFVDFRKAESWPMSWISRALIWGMYRFFRWTTGISGKHLPDFDQHFAEAEWEMERSKKWFGGMVEARLLKRPK